jgi:uncharacterized membrane protein YgcG
MAEQKVNKVAAEEDTDASIVAAAAPPAAPAGVAAMEARKTGGAAAELEDSEAAFAPVDAISAQIAGQIGKFYTIETHATDQQNKDSAPWRRVTRRYQEFAALDMELRPRHQALPPLPQKSLCFRRIFKRNFMDDREHQLGAYLSACVADPSVVAEPSVQRFLGMGFCIPRLWQTQERGAEDRQRAEEEVLRNLAEMTGASPDVCLAALSAAEGRADAAAEQLFRAGAHRNGPQGNPAETAIDEQTLNEQVGQLAEATGRSLQQCREALLERGSMEEAVDDLLHRNSIKSRGGGRGGVGGGSSSSSSSSSSNGDSIAGGGEMQGFDPCKEQLQKAIGRMQRVPSYCISSLHEGAYPTFSHPCA